MFENCTRVLLKGSASRTYETPLCMCISAPDSYPIIFQNVYLKRVLLLIVNKTTALKRYLYGLLSGYLCVMLHTVCNSSATSLYSLFTTARLI